MKKYIGTKVVEAEPEIMLKPGAIEPKYGYRVVYKDGYSSWSPKDVFEEAAKGLNCIVLA